MGCFATGNQKEVNGATEPEWKDYEAAIEDMVETTSTKRAPWHLVPANNKPFGRLAAFRVIADRLSKSVALEPRALDPKVAEAAEQLLGIRLPPGNHRGD